MFFQRIVAFVLISGLLGGCAALRTPSGAAYKAMYAHLEEAPKACNGKVTFDSDCFLVLMVEARHLDYTSNRGFLLTMAKHPSDGSKSRDVGHAWIYLQGIVDGECVCIEGGHSGERGLVQARYFDGIMNYHDFGCANPTEEMLSGVCTPTFEPNPVKYLWEIQRDGYFQYGSGRHRPTYAAKIDLTKEQFDRIWEFLGSYRFCDYSLTGQQCSSFLAQVASLGGLELECEVSMPIDPVLNLFGDHLRMWEDPAYSILTISTPDVLERSLMDAVREGRAQNVTGRLHFTK